ALASRLQPPVWVGGSFAHPLGTDQLGRDLLARVVAGARVSLLVGVVATAGAGAIGVALGLLAGFLGGRLDAVVSWLVDVQLAVPFVVMAIALTAALGRGLGTLLATLALTGWIAYARVVRMQTRSARAAPWVEAARSLGASPARVAIRHILPNLTAPILVLATQQVAAMILYEAALSYLGLGLGGKTITWGGMVAGGRETLLVAPWVSIAPGGAIALAVLGLNLLGDALIDRS
ncbi:MAG TPA: ABC transporter permease, partial [Thermomicrobiales bacterium]|nr:ABC transporter permease [Thermomicrobiales bacterium]